MKKKILTLALAGTMLCGGVVGAASNSLWGTYKGNEIIRLTVDNSPVRAADVPAISYNGRTMIPIYLLQQAGLTYSWDQANKTVNINKPASVVTSNLNKDYVSMANVYKGLEDLGELLQSTKNSFDLAALGKVAGINTQLNQAESSLSNSVNNYNNFINRSDVTYYAARDSKINQVIKIYYDSIDILKEMDSILLYSSSSDPNLSINYTNKSNAFVNSLENGLGISRNQYTNYIRLSLK